MKKILCLFILLFLANIHTGIAQNENNNSVIKEEHSKIYIKAEDYFVLDNFYDALPLFLKLDSLYPNNSNICFNIGVCYINSTSNKAKAVPFLETAIKKVSLVYTDSYEETAAPVYAYYYLAKAYHITYRLENAIQNFRKFSTYLDPINDAEILLDVNRQIEMCYNAKKIINNPVGLRIENLGASVNSKYPDYSPIVTKDEATMYFTSRRDGSTGGHKDREGKFYEDIYVSKKDAQGKWQKATPIIGGINSSGHEATISVSFNEDEIFIYKDEGGDGNIYVSKLENSIWSKPQKLGPNVNTRSWETHACLSPDGQILYFTSDRPGGMGGRDIYRSIRTSTGDWGPAQNMGSTINTIYDEESPFISSDGVTLYFSSKGHESMGGFDIFTSTLSDDGFWGEAENLGYPINTCSDDVFYVPSFDEKHAYYSSIKPKGFGEQDIYMIEITSQKKQFIVMRGYITDANTYKPLAARIDIEESESGTKIASLNTDPADGSYSVSLPNDSKYLVRVTATNYDSANYMMTVASDKLLLEIPKDFNLKKTAIAQGKEKGNIDEIMVGRTFVLNDIYYDFDKATLRPESVTELNRLINFLNEFPTMKIELRSHTDSKGSDEYNMKLSDSRAESVLKYLVSKGISADRLISKGYGETTPIATNTTDQGRQRNRRTEVKILSK